MTQWHASAESVISITEAHTTTHPVCSLIIAAECLGTNDVLLIKAPESVWSLRGWFVRAATKRRCKVTNVRTQSQCCLLAAGFTLTVISLLLLKKWCFVLNEWTLQWNVWGNCRWIRSGEIGVASAFQGQKGFRLITGHLGISKYKAAELVGDDVTASNDETVRKDAALHPWCQFIQHDHTHQMSTENPTSVTITWIVNFQRLWALLTYTDLCH